MSVSHPSREKTAATPREEIRTTGSQPFSFDFDIYLLLTVGILLAVGLMMVFSTTFDWSYQVFGSPTRIFLLQVRSLVVGLVVMFVAARIDYHWVRRLALPIFVVTGLVLLLLLLLRGPDDATFGAQRAFLNGSYQPGEVAKLTMVMVLAGWLHNKADSIKKITYLLPFAAAVGLVCGLIVLQPDLSNALIIFIVAWSLFFLAGANVFQLLASVGAAGLVGYLLTLQFSYARDRLVLHWQAVSDLTTASWHVQQAVIAFTAPGHNPLNPSQPNIFGVGLGQSSQKFGYLPAPHTDSIFAIIGEELGLIGTLFVVALYIVLAYRGLTIARNAADSYGGLLAAGITLWIATEAILNVAVMTAVMPFTGVPLPMISYGGSSLVTVLAGMGLLLNISRTEVYRKSRRTLADYSVGRRDGRGRVSRVGSSRGLTRR